MAWGTSIEAYIFLPRQRYGSSFEVEGEINDTKRAIASHEQQLMMWAVGGASLARTTDDVGNYIDKVGSIQCEINSILEAYKEELSHLYDLQLLLENFDKRIEK